MKAKLLATSWRLLCRNAVGQALLFLILTGQLHAQQSPWAAIAERLAGEFTGPIAKGLSLVAIVVGGLTIAFSENGGSRRIIGGLVFGLGMALGAVSFVRWLFGI